MKHACSVCQNLSTSSTDAVVLYWCTRHGAFATCSEDARPNSDGSVSGTTFLLSGALSLRNAITSARARFCRCQVPEEACLRLRHCHKAPWCTVNSRCCAALCQHRSKRLVCMLVWSGYITLCSVRSASCQNDAIILTLHGKLSIHTCPLMPFCMQVCYHCLTPLTSAASTHNAAGHSFCSAYCESTARALFYDVEAALNLLPLYAKCKAQSECFPLIVARAACMRLSQARHPGQQMHSPSMDAKHKMLQGNIWQVLSGELPACP